MSWKGFLGSHYIDGGHTGGRERISKLCMWTQKMDIFATSRFYIQRGSPFQMPWKTVSGTFVAEPKALFFAEVLFSSQIFVWDFIYRNLEIPYNSLCERKSHKTGTETANRWGTTNSKPIRNMEQQSDHIYDVHSSLAGAQLCCIFTSLSKLCKNAEPKPFSWAKQACFDFSSSHFNVEGLH